MDTKSPVIGRPTLSSSDSHVARVSQRFFFVGFVFFLSVISSFLQSSSFESRQIRDDCSAIKDGEKERGRRNGVLKSSAISCARSSASRKFGLWRSRADGAGNSARAHAHQSDEETQERIDWRVLFLHPGKQTIKKCTQIFTTLHFLQMIQLSLESLLTPVQRFDFKP
jgi:hypothetical protein